MSLEGQRRIVDWQGNNERDQASGDRQPELQEDGSHKSEIRLHNAGHSAFIATPWPTSLTAC